MTRKRLDIYPDDDLVAAIDRWRATQGDLPSRAAAARLLLAAGIEAGDFELMLAKLVHRLRQRPNLPTEAMLNQADDLLRRKGVSSILRAEKRRTEK